MIKRKNFPLFSHRFNIYKIFFIAQILTIKNFPEFIFDHFRTEDKNNIFFYQFTVNSTQVIEIESSSTTSLLNADKNHPKSNMVEQMVTSNGGWLELEHLEVR